MLTETPVCSNDGSKLVFLLHGEDSLCYCPRCDLAFLFLAAPGASTGFEIVRWFREDGEFELDIKNSEVKGWNQLPQQVRDSWESSIQRRVSAFAKGRNPRAFRIRCGMDGSEIPAVKRLVTISSRQLKLGWCRSCSSCGRGTLLSFDDDYGWEFYAFVYWNAETRTYYLGERSEGCGGHVVPAQLLEAFAPLDGNPLAIMPVKEVRLMAANLKTTSSWVQKTPGVCGGDACIRNTRITVHGLVHYRQLGLTDERLVEIIQGLTQDDLAAAWDYYASHAAEIQEAIRVNEEA
jgi:uncharacterized protein (DUF433 family)